MGATHPMESKMKAFALIVFAAAAMLGAAARAQMPERAEDRMI